MLFSNKRSLFRSLILVLMLFWCLAVNGVSEANEYKEFTINIEETYQTIEGFGASIAWYENWVTAHPNKKELYNVLFKELGLDILRLQNWYGKQPETGAHTTEIVKEAERSLGRPIKILISSWSPPASLKSNNDVEHGGTLKKENGQYLYQEFANYWYDSLMAYAKVGIVPEYISIQNEPDYKAEWNSCLFGPEETKEVAGYDKALAAVYNKLQEMDNPPKIIGPETIGIGYDAVEKYSQKMNMDYIYALAHHLYHGGDYTNPTTFSYKMRKIRVMFPEKLIFQTEFERGDGFQTAWVIHNALVEESVNAYLYWDLVWVDRGLVKIENPWRTSNWETKKGFNKNNMYYAVQHYAKFTEPGYKRVEAKGDSNRLKVSAFISPDGKQLVIVALNTLFIEEKLKLNLLDYQADESQIYRTAFMGIDGERFTKIGSLEEGQTIALPGLSMVTVVLKR